MQDGGGYQWDIRQYGSAYRGTNYAFNNGMMLQIVGAGQFNSNSARRNEAGDEVELGPYTAGGLKVHRRIRAYKDRPLARWLDIYSNETSADIKRQVMLQTQIAYGIRQTTTTDGDVAWGEKDWYAVTVSANQQSPQLLHIPCDSRKVAVRPQLRVQNNVIMTTFDLTIPAGKTVIVCSFLSQGRTPAEHQQIVKDFKVATLLADLPSAVRRQIVNFRTGTQLGVDLDRAADADMVVLHSGDTIYGQIVSEAFTVGAFFGEVSLPANRLLGMAVTNPDDRQIAAVLTDGQVVRGLCDQPVEIVLSTGGRLTIPLADVKQWSYRISDERSDLIEVTGPMVTLRTGDRLAFNPAGAALTLQTACGTIDLDPQALLGIRLDNDNQAVHRAVFVNESTLAGMLGPEEITLTLALGPELTVQRPMLAAVHYALEPTPDALLTTMTLANGDVLNGTLTDQVIELQCDYGDQSLAPNNIRQVEFSKTNPGRATVTLWDKTQLRGQMVADTLTFQITPGPTLAVPTARIVSVARSVVLPPEETRLRVEALVAQLGAESYADRQKATEELTGMGPNIAPLLKPYAEDDDPEIRQRIGDILDALGRRPGR
jgi:hypothetical protein